MTPPRDLHNVISSLHADLELPDGYRAEVVKGQLAMWPRRADRHSYIVREVQRLARILGPTHIAVENVALQEPDDGRYATRRDATHRPVREVGGTAVRRVLDTEAF